jgi:integrase
MSKSFVRRERRDGVLHLVIDFPYRNKEGRARRYRRDAKAPTMAGAKAEAERLRHLAATTGSPYGKPEAPTFAAFVRDTYVPLFAARLRPATQEHYQRLLNGPGGLIAAFGAMPVDRIDGSALRRYAAERHTRGVTSRAHVSLTASVLRAAVTTGVLAMMPAVPREKESPKLPDAPSLDEARKIVELATDWFKSATALAVFAGLRSGEVRALRVADVDLAQGAIRVRRTYSADQLVGGGKGGKERVVPVAAPLAPVLAEAMRNKLPGAHIVTNARGLVPSRRRLYHRLQSLLAANDMPPRSFHSLRHCFGSALLANGASVEVTRLLLGHSRLTTTSRYLHAQPSEAHRAIARLSGNRLETAEMAK